MNRRHFITTTTLAALAGLSHEAFAGKRKQIGLQLYTLRNEIGKMGIAKVIEAVAGMGYKKMEAFGHDKSKVFSVTPQEYANILKANGLSGISGHYLPNAITNDEAWKRTLEEANLIGQKYANIAYVFETDRTPERFKKITDDMNRAGVEAQKQGITLGYHNHDFEFTQQIDGMKMYDFILKNTDAKMELDLYWIAIANENPMAYFEKHPGRFPLLHVKDMAKTPKREFAEVGQGSMDFAAIFAARKLAGVKHYFVEQDVCQRPPLESVKMSADYLKTVRWS